MKDEVEDFLRRVAQMRPEPRRRPRGSSCAAAEAGPAKPPSSAPQPPLGSCPRAGIVPGTPVDAGNRRCRTGRKRRSRRAARGPRLRGTEQIAEHTRRLGADVDAANDKMQAHLHQVFDHQLGRLKSSRWPNRTRRDSRELRPELSLDQIMRLLRSPGSVRDAIVMSEILRRPECAEEYQGSENRTMSSGPLSPSRSRFFTLYGSTRLGDSLRSWLCP